MQIYYQKEIKLQPMSIEIETTIEELTKSVIQFNLDIKNGNLEGIKIFLEKFPQLIKRYAGFNSPSHYTEFNHFLSFKDEISKVFDYLFKGRIYDIAEEIFIKNGDMEIYGEGRIINFSSITDKIESIREEGNYLNRKGNSMYSFPVLELWPNGTNPFEDFVSKYQSLFDEMNQKKQYPEKYYAWYHQILILLGKADKFPDYFGKKEIVDFGKKKYNTGETFYREYIKSDIQGIIDSFRSVRSMNNKDRASFKKIIRAISNNDADVIFFLNSIPN